MPWGPSWRWVETWITPVCCSGPSAWEGLIAKHEQEINDNLAKPQKFTKCNDRLFQEKLLFVSYEFYPIIKASIKRNRFMYRKIGFVIIFHSFIFG